MQRRENEAVPPMRPPRFCEIDRERAFSEGGRKQEGKVRCPLIAVIREADIDRKRAWASCIAETVVARSLLAPERRGDRARNIDDRRLSLPFVGPRFSSAGLLQDRSAELGRQGARADA